jgi:hypothetical protein
MSAQCPATTRYAAPDTGDITGLQCKFAPGHDCDHCAAPPGFQSGPDVFWPQEEVIVRTGRAADEEHIREMVSAAMASPGRFVYGP